MRLKQGLIAFIVVFFLTTLSGCATWDEVIDELNYVAENLDTGYYDDTYYDEEVYDDDTYDDVAAGSHPLPRGRAKPQEPRRPHAAPERDPRDRRGLDRDRERRHDDPADKSMHDRAGRGGHKADREHGDKKADPKKSNVKKEDNKKKAAKKDDKKKKKK